MLIKASRIRASAGAGALARHLKNGDDNESIVMVRGTIADLHDAVTDAKRFNRVYALRHFVIAPQIAMNRQQFERAAKALGDEFGFDPDMALVVEHQKARSVEGVADRHWHIVVAETDASTGKVLSSSFSHPRHEKVARLLELEFGHPIIAGAHDVAVLAALRGEGQADLAERLAGALGHGPKTASAYTTKAHQAAKRSGIDLAQARQHIREAWADSTNADDFRTRLAGHGLELAAGDKPGVLIVRTIAGGVVLGAANRLTGARRADFTAFLERADHDHQHPTERSDRRPDDLGRHGHPQTRSGHDPVARQGDGAADGGGDRELPRLHHEPAPDDRGRDRAKPEVAGGTSRQTGRAGDRHGASQDAGSGLIAAFTTAVRALAGIDGKGIGMSHQQRLANHLEAIEAKAHAEIAAAKALPSPTQSRLDAARLYEKATGQRHDDLIKRLRAVEASLSIPVPTPSITDRLLGRKPADPVNRVALEREHADIRSELIDAGRNTMAAIATVARAEKDHAAARVAHHAEADGMVRHAQEMLAEVERSRRIVSLYPRLVWTGPVFATWTGQKYERTRRRREVRNPWARNLWGLPLDFG